MRYFLLNTLLAGLVGCSASSDEGSALDDSVRQSIRESIDKFNSRTIYESLDPEILATIADEDIEQAVVDYVITKLEGRFSQESEILATLPDGVRALWLTLVVEGQVNNGGFNQYYWNTEDRFATEAVEAFKFFSAIEHASLMQEANRIRAQEFRIIQKFKDQGTLSAFSESYDNSKLGPLDDRYYALEEDLSALRVAKIRSHPELFSGN